MDGTLTVSNIPFDEMRQRTTITEGDLFTVMEEWSDSARVCGAMDVIDELEAASRATLELQLGLEALLEQCVADGLRVALVTRNTDLAVDALFSRLGERWRPVFDPLLTRHFALVKPDARLLRHVAAAWGCQPCELLMVGDSREDVEVGAAVGAPTCLIAGGGNGGGLAGGVTPTYTASSLDDLARALRGGAQLHPPAALPHGLPFLQALLAAGVLRPSPVSYPRIGAAGRGFARCPPGGAPAPNLLHIDCGDGALTKTLHSHGIAARGVDADAEAVAVAAGRGLRAAQQAQLQAAEAAYDCLLLCQHPSLPTPASLLLDAAGCLCPAALLAAAAALRPGGALAVAWRPGPQGEAAAADAARRVGAAGLRVVPVAGAEPCCVAVRA